MHQTPTAPTLNNKTTSASIGSRSIHLLNFPTEIRLRIYSELLVQDKPIEFGADHGPCNPRLIWYGMHGFCPALLRVNKMVNREAISLLYSNNRFEFPDAYTSSYKNDVPYIAPFLRQIGHNAGLLRHICINFPTSFASWTNPALHTNHIQVLQLIRELCTDLRKVEISCKPPDGILSLWDIDKAAAMLRALDDGGLKAMPSLEKIVVVREEYNIDEEDVALRERLMQKMPSSKWCIELIKVPPRVWISDDDMVQFDNYEDCCSYNEEVHRREWERQEIKEQELWEEELHHRRLDPYWKNDSDYD